MTAAASPKPRVDKQAVHDLLMGYADMTGDQSYARGAAALLHEPPGRKAKDDRSDVLEAMQLVDAGTCPSDWDACLQLASKYYGNQDTIAKRLHGKLGLQRKASGSPRQNRCRK